MRAPVLPEQRVSEVAESVPGAARVFELLGVDACCSGSKTLAAAAESAGVQAGELLDLLCDDEATPLRVSEAPAGFAAQTLADQVEHLVSRHHRYTRKQLLRLDRLLTRVWSGHRGAKALPRVRGILDELLRHLIPHMAREEQYLFPYMRSLEGKMKPDDRVTIPLFGNLQYPLSTITHDHSDDSSRLMELRDATGGFDPAAESCPSIRRLYAGLGDLERDIQEHIRIENQIVFPRAVELERAARERAASGS